ncbi:MAG TPA: Asp-tRNA(Asn)/Glu-tRNA(Gln) amidotransferase GatCAB subunit A, partial [Arthrobacter bacterium]|nr:Asp-tRNA(Asn)/Glu-tRNA(Gln) amidotransferase GatCAB subunit A [Arthrobacter sp.]HCN21421.1 Asp-tRNA(Asn)/Glu-tRNA(Gln) amidotransferase GatCAB subunit A [Arthrobacter sp.]
MTEQNPTGSGSVSSADGLIRSTAAQLAAMLAAGEVTSVEVTQAYLDRIAAVDGGERGVNAFLHVNTEEALAVAAEVDAIRAAGGA